MAYNAKKVFIFHFTHVDNFPAILNEGLWADASIDCDKYKNIGNVEIILGDSLGLIDKVNIALNLIEQGTITKGYIDLSLEGRPVIKQS